MSRSTQCEHIGGLKYKKILPCERTANLIIEDVTAISHDLCYLAIYCFYQAPDVSKIDQLIYRTYCPPGNI
ncbi:hypothetical protein XELAEV_18032132mg [Xenopus laevis]|uniref:Uncharacterized protein n=1 Tax=Xenopus laevis TaxID=8355 RepID=A0A974CP05_XENLA|nr:hypothetical protein XELAEV_18032132mg [Xenopus laevis]